MEALKNAKNCEEKDAFYYAVDNPLDSAIKGCAKGTFDGARKDGISDLPKYAQRVRLRLHLRVLLSYTCCCTC